MSRSQENNRDGRWTVPKRVFWSWASHAPLVLILTLYNRSGRLTRLPMWGTLRDWFGSPNLLAVPWGNLRRQYSSFSIAVLQSACCSHVRFARIDRDKTDSFLPESRYHDWFRRARFLSTLHCDDLPKPSIRSDVRRLTTDNQHPGKLPKIYLVLLSIIHEGSRYSMRVLCSVPATPCRPSFPHNPSRPSPLIGLPKARPIQFRVPVMMESNIGQNSHQTAWSESLPIDLRNEQVRNKHLEWVAYSTSTFETDFNVVQGRQEDSFWGRPTADLSKTREYCYNQWRNKVFFVSAKK